MFCFEIFIIHIFSLTIPANSTHGSGLMNRTISKSQKTFKEANTQSLSSARVLYRFAKVPRRIIQKGFFASPYMTKSPGSRAA